MPRRPVVVRETRSQPLKRSEIIDNIHTAFDAIGHTASTMPTVPSTNNNGAAAFEYFAAHRLARRAEARKKRATTQAVEAGVIFDHTKTPLEPGTNAHPVFLGDQVFISCTVANITDKVDWEAIVTDLVNNKKVAIKEVEALVKKYTMPKAERGAHTFSSTLIIP